MLKGMKPLYGQIEDGIPEVSEAALITFKRLHPDADVTTWADCLALLFEGGDFMSITEPLRQTLASEVARKDRKYIDLVAFSWFFATGTWPTTALIRSTLGEVMP